VNTLRIGYRLTENASIVSSCLRGEQSKVPRRLWWNTSATKGFGEWIGQEERRNGGRQEEVQTRGMAARLAFLGWLSSVSPGSSSFMVDTCWQQIPERHHPQRHDRTRGTEKRRTAEREVAALAVDSVISAPPWLPPFLRFSCSIYFPGVYLWHKISTTDDEETRITEDAFSPIRPVAFLRGFVTSC